MNRVIHQHRSLGLRSIVSKLVEKGDTILDLGRMSTLTAPLFLQLHCRCFIEDLNEYVEDLSVNNDNPVDRLSDFLLDKPAETTFDIILCWDLFNFLSLELISHLMALLKPYLKPGTVLHTIRYIGGTTPKLPRHFKHLGNFDYQVQDSPAFVGDGLAPQAHTTIMLLRSLPEFSLYDTALNQEGMMKDVAEYLLEYDSLVKDKKVRKGLNSQDVGSYFTQEEEGATSIEFIGLKKLLERTANSTTATALDIGPKNGRKFTYLHNHCHDLYIEDVYSSIAWQNKLIGDNISTTSKQLLNFSVSVEFDFVLLWDTLNFCSPSQIQTIGELLSKHLTVGALLHILIYKGNETPIRPLMFEIKEDKKVKTTGDLNNGKPKILRSIAELMRLLPQFRLNFHHLGDKANQHNYQEFILEYKG